MGTLLTRSPWRLSLGLLIEEQEIVASLVRWPLTTGPVEVERVREAYQLDELQPTVARLLESLIPGKRRVQVAVGLPARRLFCTTRPNPGGRHDAAPELLLQEVLRSPNVNVADMVIDLLPSKTRGKPIISLASCRKRYLTNVLTALDHPRVRLERIEPAPCGLVRVAAQWHRSPGRARTVIRLFLGAARGLVVLVVNDLPLVWRSFELSESGGAVPALVSCVRSLRVMGGLCGVEEGPEVLILHGRPGFLQPDELTSLGQQLRLPLSQGDRPELGDGSEAFGLALGCQQNTNAFDLARNLKPPTSIWEAMPVGEVAIQAAVLLCASLYLMNRVDNGEQDLRQARVETVRHAWAAKLSDADLEKRHKELTAKVNTVSNFLGSRINWTNYTRDLGNRLTGVIHLAAMQGACPFASSEKGTSSSAPPQLKLSLEAQVSRQTSAVPKEIDEFVKDLRTHPLLKRDFPQINMGSLSWGGGGDPRHPGSTAQFSVTCLGKPKSKGEKATGK